MASIPLKNMKVNWDDVIPNIWKNNPLMFQTSNQLLKFQQFSEKWTILEDRYSFVMTRQDKPRVPLNGYVKLGTPFRQWMLIYYNLLL